MSLLIWPFLVFWDHGFNNRRFDFISLLAFFGLLILAGIVYFGVLVLFGFSGWVLLMFVAVVLIYLGLGLLFEGYIHP